MAEPPSSPPSENARVEDALAWYKSQYEQLEAELSDFQASSKELEAELEKDLDAADKRERQLQQKAEALTYEVEEWKRKYKESKLEANAAQNALEKEITTLRDANRTLQLTLRDIEVANDDFERQARNTTSSLSDLESKYNVSIERAVMLEEEVKLGEQEREHLRVDSQRLREELSDLKIEAEILQDKMKKQEEREERHLSTISTEITIPESPTFDRSPNSTASSPLILTPPDSKSFTTAETVSDVQDPPSPPRSDISAPLPRKVAAAKTPASTMRKSRLPSADHSITPKPKQFTTSTAGRTPGARAATTGNAALRTPAPPMPAPNTIRSTSHKIPPSNSLTQIRSLTAQMARLEARVHSARSKLPAPISTPPRASPRGTTTAASGAIPSTVTIRSRKRTIGSTASSLASSVAGRRPPPETDEATPTNARHRPDPITTTDLRASTSTKSHVPRLSTSASAGVSRLSFGPLPNRNPPGEDSSRPSSRASVSSYARPTSRTDSYASNTMPPPRPMSRTSLSGARTPLGRPRSSLGGSVHGHAGHAGHGHSQSVTFSTTEMDELSDDLRTPSRRGTYSRFDAEAAAGSAIPLPGARRKSGGSGLARRSSSGLGLRDAGGTGMGSTLEDVGETY